MTEVARPGALVLVGTPIGNLGDLSPRAVDELHDADVIACEDTRRTRALLTHAQVPASGKLRAVHAHNEAAAAARVVEEVTAGMRVAYVSDAGMPGVSDPGARLVRACVDAGLAVEVVPGPSAVIAALVVSGLPTDRFTFEGFLPRRGPERRARVAAIADETRTVVLYESPRRLGTTLAELAAACGHHRRAAVVRELTKRFEEVRRGTLDELARDCPAEPRGEHVVVIAGAGPAPPPDERAIERAVAAAIERGSSARDAATEVARDLAVPKRQAYEIAVRLTKR